MVPVLNISGQHALDITALKWSHTAFYLGWEELYLGSRWSGQLMSKHNIKRRHFTSWVQMTLVFIFLITGANCTSKQPTSSAAGVRSHAGLSERSNFANASTAELSSLFCPTHEQASRRYCHTRSRQRITCIVKSVSLFDILSIRLTVLGSCQVEKTAIGTI